MYRSAALVAVQWCIDPFECDCHLAWLLRDNRHLLQTVMFGKCSNGTWFTDLDPDAFANCPVRLICCCCCYTPHIIYHIYYRV